MPLIQVISAEKLLFNDKSYRCAIGPAGFTQDKREGDKATPVGEFALRECWYRADRVAPPQTKLPLRRIAESDGWCDAPEDLQYNRHVTLPYAASHEKLWLEDHTYDVMVPLGYNDDPIIPGKGSAIFLHVAKPGYTPTAGCVALALPDLLEVLRFCSLETKLKTG